MKYASSDILVALAIALAAQHVHAADSAHPTVVELFQSQGCSSCPPANAILNTLADRPDILPLSFAVTYWDKLGWKDQFAQAKFTARQYEYSSANHTSGVYTPQMVINGTGLIVGNTPDAVSEALARYDRGVSGPAINITAKSVTIGRAPERAPAIVWLAQYDPRTVAVAVRAGENNGRTLPHRNIVKSLTQIGEWRGQFLEIARPAVSPGLQAAILVQVGTGGKIVAALKL
jgi:hypothetical protein